MSVILVAAEVNVATLVIREFFCAVLITDLSILGVGFCYPTCKHTTRVIEEVCLTLDVCSLTSLSFTGGLEVVPVLICICVIILYARLYGVDPILLDTSTSLVAVEGCVLIECISFINVSVAVVSYPTCEHLTFAIEVICFSFVCDLLVGSHLTSRLEVIPLLISALIIVRSC